jgi:hypothetical protein
MKTLFLFLGILLAGSFCLADETIIEPELMNQDTWAEPYFPSQEEMAREPSSENGAKEYVKNSDEYLDILKKIPVSEPTLSRSWLEYKIMHEE